MKGGFLFLKLLEEFNKVKAENKNCIVFIKSGAGVSTKILDSSLIVTNLWK